MSKKLIPMAICYDFDGTLSPGNMQEYEFMDKLGVKAMWFWKKSLRICFRQKIRRRRSNVQK